MNTRPRDFPTDEKIDEARKVNEQCRTLAALLDAFTGYTEPESIPAQWGREDGKSGAMFAPEQWWVIGSVKYMEYVNAFYEARNEAEHD